LKKPNLEKVRIQGCRAIIINNSVPVLLRSPKSIVTIPWNTLEAFRHQSKFS
jgi:hypothetical protein